MSFCLEFLAAINPTNLTDFLATLTPCDDDFDFGDDLPADPVTVFDDFDLTTLPSSPVDGQEDLDVSR